MSGCCSTLHQGPRVPDPLWQSILALIVLLAGYISLAAWYRP